MPHSNHYYLNNDVFVLKCCLGEASRTKLITDSKGSRCLMIDTGLFYKCYGMQILSPKKQINFCFGNTTRNISSPVQDSGITHRGCTKAET